MYILGVNLKCEICAYETQNLMNHYRQHHHEQIYERNELKQKLVKALGPLGTQIKRMQGTIAPKTICESCDRFAGRNHLCGDYLILILFKFSKIF